MNEEISSFYVLLTVLLFDSFPISIYLFFNERSKKQLNHLETRYVNNKQLFLFLVSSKWKHIFHGLAFMGGSYSGHFYFIDPLISFVFFLYHLLLSVYYSFT